MAFTALISSILKFLEPILKVFLKKYQQPKVHMKIKLESPYLYDRANQPAKYLPIPVLEGENQHSLIYTYEITLKNNSEYNAYNFFNATKPYELSEHYQPSEKTGSSYVMSNMLDELEPLLVNQSQKFSMTLVYPFTGTKDEAKAALFTNYFRGPFRIIYSNISDRKYYTELHYQHSSKVGHKFGSV